MSKELSNWAERKRLEFIEKTLFWRGWINRKDVTEAFGVSMPQATNDLVNYCTLNMGKCAYNVRTKRYETADDFAPMLTVASAWEDLAQIAPTVWSDDAQPLLAEPELPMREASLPVCRAVSRAIFSRQALEIRYWSAHSAQVERRTISPRAIGNDGLRLHTRALCHKDEVFKDFNLGRIEKIVRVIECPFTDRVDEDWQHFAQLRIVPNPALPAVVQKTLARDYGMKRGVYTLRVRRAMLFYATRRLGFINATPDNLPLLNEVKELRLESITDL